MDIEELNRRLRGLAGEVDRIYHDLHKSENERLKMAFSKHFPLQEAADILDPLREVKIEYFKQLKPEEQTFVLSEVDNFSEEKATLDKFH